tara:strand:- start:520 stop:1101 length:582 start_codon:yes stop_codon:yes gene_type:complete
VNITCNHCSQKIDADPSFAGKTVNCPSCNEEISIPKSKKSEMNKLNQILPWLSLSLAIIAIVLHFNIFSGTSLKFETPEDAIKTLAKLEKDASFKDLMKVQQLFKEDLDWRSVDPSKLEIKKTLEVKNTGDDDHEGSVLCFLQFKKDDGVDSHVVVLLIKNKKGLFNSGYLNSSIKEEYGILIKAWEKDGTLK